MREYLVPLFQLFLYGGGLLFVVTVYKWRDRLYAMKGHFFLVSLALPVLGLFFLSRGVAATSLGQGAVPLILGGASILVGVAVQAYAIYKFVTVGAISNHAGGRI